MTTRAAPPFGRPVRALAISVALALTGATGACDRIWPPRPDTTLPAIADVRGIFHANGLDADTRLAGNVVEIRVEQPAEQLRRGGSLWARVGPWIYVFNPGTREVFERYPGVAAVRVITRSNGREVARAVLRNGVLSSVLWRRSLNIMGRAVQEGTESPIRLSELAEWGERYGEYTYNPEFVPR